MVLGLPNWVLGCAHGLLASAWALGAGTKVLGRRGVATSLEAGGRSPGRVPGVTPWGLLPNVVVSEHAYSCGTRRRPFVRACLVFLLGKKKSDTEPTEPIATLIVAPN